MMLGTMAGEYNQGNILFGAFLGLMSVAAIGYLWVKHSKKINLKVFMQVTGIFLILFCIHLFIYGLHELTEVGAIPFVDNFYWHTKSEPFEPGQPIGNMITFSLLAIPCLWLVYSAAWDKYVRPRFVFLAV